jgi:hypothetical protein
MVFTAADCEGRGRGIMVLTEEQEATFRELCKAINPGEYGRVIVLFVGAPSNLVQITGEKNYRFHNGKTGPRKEGA